MKRQLSRRAFIKGSIVAGCSLFFPARTLHTGKIGETWRPAYRELDLKGELQQRIDGAYALFEACGLCPRACGVNRIKGELGFCRAPVKTRIYAAHPHRGEERSLSGTKGSGTIFFSNCNLRCVFCQNWPISIDGLGQDISDNELADTMLHLQRIGCHNINLVTPTHVMPNILNAVKLACRHDLRIPLVYNTSGYETIEALKLLDGVVDIYLPDMKYMDPEKADIYSSGAYDYPEVAKRAIIEMHRQVGEHRTDDFGIAVRGLMIRHLVMPNRVAGTEKFVKWVATNLPKSTYVNIMCQYHVDYKAYEYPEIWRRITVGEYVEAMEWAKASGLSRLDPESLRMLKLYKGYRES